MKQTELSDSLNAYDRNSKLPIDSVANEDTMIEPVRISIKNIGVKKNPKRVSREELNNNDGRELANNESGTGDASADNILSAGFYDVSSIAEAVKSDDITSGTLDDEEFNTAIEAYENENIRFDTDSDILNDGVDISDALSGIGDTIDQVKDDNIHTLTVATEYLYDKLALKKRFSITVEDFDSLGSKNYTSIVKESLMDHVVEIYHKVIAFIKDMWNRLVNGVKKLFSTVYDFIRSKASKLKKANDEAPNAAKEAASSDKYTTLKTQLVRAFSETNAVTPLDVEKVLDNQIKIRTLIDNLNNNLLLRIFELVRSSDEKAIGLNEYKDFFNDTYLNKFVSTIENKEFVFNCKIEKDKLKIGRIEFTKPVKEVVSDPIVNGGNKQHINDIITNVLFSNELVKKLYQKVESINDTKDQVLDHLVLDLKRLGNNGNLEVTKKQSKLILLFFMDLSKLIKDLAFLSTTGNRYALKYCEYSIKARQGV